MKEDSGLSGYAYEDPARPSSASITAVDRIRIRLCTPAGDLLKVMHVQNSLTASELASLAMKQHAAGVRGSILVSGKHKQYSNKHEDTEQKHGLEHYNHSSIMACSQ